MGDAYERGYVSAGITHLTKPLPHPSCISLRTIQRNPTWQAVEAVERASVVWVSDGSGSGGSWRPASKIREQGGGVDSKDNLQRSDPEEESRISDERRALARERKEIERQRMLLEAQREELGVISSELHVAPPSAESHCSERCGATGGGGGRSETSSEALEHGRADVLRHQQHLQGSARGTASSSERTEDRACVVCFGRPRTHALLPCGHRVLCSMCAAQYEQFAALQRSAPRPGAHSKAHDGRAGPHGAAPATGEPQAAHHVRQGRKGVATAAVSPKLPAGKQLSPATDGRAGGSDACNADGAPGMHSTCPICRADITGVLHVWDS